MKSIKAILLGIPIGLLMGFVLFLVGAIVAMLFWQGAPPGKFTDEMIPPLIFLLTKTGISVKLMSPVYFLFTKLGFGVILGISYGLIFSKFVYQLPSKRIYRGSLFGLFLWFITAFPIFPITLSMKKEVFWLLYTFSGLVTFGLIFGIFYKISPLENSPDSYPPLTILQWLKKGIIAGLIMGTFTVLISRLMAIIANVLKAKFFTIPEIFNAQFILPAIMFSIIWGFILVPVYHRLVPALSANALRQALSLGLLLWLIRWLMDIVHKICYSQTPALTLLFNYINPCWYFLFFILLLNFINKKMEMVK